MQFRFLTASTSIRCHHIKVLGRNNRMYATDAIRIRRSQNIKTQSIFFHLLRSLLTSITELLSYWGRVCTNIGPNVPPSWLWAKLGSRTFDYGAFKSLTCSCISCLQSLNSLGLNRPRITQLCNIFEDHSNYSPSTIMQRKCHYFLSKSCLFHIHR